MKILVLEDEKPSADKLIQSIKTYDEKFEIIGSLASVQEALKWFEFNSQPDLIFADIRLSDGLSFEIFKHIEINSPVIFTTAYDQYAIDAFEFNGIGYLLKPYNFEKLSQCLDKFRAIKSQRQPSIDLGKLIESFSTKTTSYKSRFLVKNGNKISAIKTSEIAYFLTDNKLSFLVTRENKKFPVDFSLDDITQMLDPKEFFRINRKFIIHIDSAKEINPYFKGRLKISLSPAIQEEIIISNDKASAFKEWLDQ